jgi:hypothetical protein
MTRLAPDRLGHLIFPESFLQPGKQSVESLAAIGAEEIDCQDLVRSGLQFGELGLVTFLRLSGHRIKRLCALPVRG